MTPTRLVVGGCCGRMGSLIVEEAAREPARFQVVGGVESEGHPQLGRPLSGSNSAKVTSDLGGLLRGADLLIEFTTPAATLEHARAAAKGGVPMIIGTTGLSEERLEELRSLARQIPIFWSPNMSVGIVIVRRMIQALSQLLLQFGLAEKTQVKIAEVHHTRKVDKPSGTAKALARELFEATGWLIRDEEIEARREGDVVGIHSVSFRLPSENLTLQHEATDRRVFAQGALLVAGHFHRLWTQPGWYGMDHFVAALQESPRK